MGKAIYLSLKAIKVTVEPYIGQTCNFGGYNFFWFFSSNINKGKYKYPIGEMEWKYQKQLFQVKKGVYQFVKISFTKKPQK
jgi:hypothetical protein